MKKLSLALIPAAALVAGCVIVDGEVVHDFDEWESHSRYERVYSAAVERDTIYLKVYSTGCTTEEFFEPRVEHEGHDEFTVGFKRVRQDYCDIDGVTSQKIQYSFASLGLPVGAEVTVKNPVGQ